MLSANGSRAYPILTYFNATLEHNIDHGWSADNSAVHIDASFLPSMDHFILADPLTIKLNTVVWRLVQVKDILEAELNAVMPAAKGRVMVIERRGEFSFNPVSIVHCYFLTMEKAVKIRSADMVLINVHAHLLLDVIHVLLTNELTIDIETTSMLEGRVEISWTHQLTVSASMTTFMVISFEVLNNNWITRANFEAV